MNSILKKNTLKYFNILKDAVNGFMNDKCMKLSGSLAYSTIFSLPPMLLLIIIVGGSFYGQDAIQGKIFYELKDIIGANTAMQVQDIIKGLQLQEHNSFATVISAIVLMVGATGIFVEIQDSLNFIWGVKPKPKKGIIKLVINRLLSFSMIIGLGFLLIVSLIVNTILVAISKHLIDLLPPNLPINLLNLLNNAIVFFVLSFLFSIIFKMLPDVKLKWKQIWPGAFVTALLFFVGKFLIGIYIGNTKTVSLYGAAGSVIVLLLWIYFSAAILYFGAQFTRAYINAKGEKIIPNNFAEFTSRHVINEENEKL